ncbi:MAG: LysR family transcriptional regulator, partial [Robiginitomaculum sp.]|nr:LysR family transcriptional regulator [Robiginitomaculum sp.]
MTNVTLRQLRYFEALARHGHFGNAAKTCAISQPALSVQIKETLNNMAFGMRKLSIAARVHGTSRFAAAFATVLPRSPDFRQTPPS